MTYLRPTRRGGSGPKRSRVVGVAGAIACVVFLVLAAGCGGGSGAEDSTQAAGATTAKCTNPAKMTLIFDWIPNSTHFFYFDAVKQGYYADECLDVKYLTPGDVTVPSKVVADGSKAQVGIVLAPDVVFGQNTGQPIKSIFTLWQDSEYGILTLSDVKSPKDFEGHKVALLANFEKSAFAQMMKKAGGDASKVDVIQAGFSVVPPVVGKKVMGATGGAIYELPECTAQLGPGKCKLFKYEDYGYPPEQLVVIANTNWAKTHGDVLRRFTKASLMGLAYSIAHPAASTANFAKQFPDTNQKTTLAIYKRIIPAEQSAATKANGLGYQEPAVWAALLTALQNDMGVSKTLKPSDLFTNAYLPSPPIH